MRTSSPILGLHRRHHTIREALATVLAALLLGGCMTWRRADVPPQVLLARPGEMVVRVTRQGGEQIVLQAPVIIADTLRGTVRWGAELTVVAIPLRDVVSVEVQQLDAASTTVAVAALGATMIAVIAAANSVSGGGGGRQPPPPSPGWGGSCPLAYSWDGMRWRRDSGTFGGAITRGLQRTDVDNLDYATPEDGVLRLRVTNELAETDYLDALGVLAVDVDSGFAVAPDPTGRLHVIGALVLPVGARDFRGDDALPRVRQADGWNWESGLTGRDPARAADLRDGLEVEFVRPPGATRAHLVLDGNSSPWGGQLLYEFVRAHGTATQAWYDSLDAQPALAQAVGMRLAREAFLAAAVRTPAGWMPQGMYWEAGPELVKRQVLDLDLSRVRGDTVVVRLESAPAFWLVDRVALDFTTDRDLAVHELPLVSASDQAGRDVGPLIATADDRYYVLRHGDAGDRCAVIEGSSLGSLGDLLSEHTAFLARGDHRPPSPLTLVRYTPGAGGALLAHTHAVHGPVYYLSAGSVSAMCAIGEAYLKVASGMVDVALTGGGESPLQRDVAAAFLASGVLARDNGAPAACRPFDRHRSGTVLGEGAGALVLESAEHAHARGAHVRAVVTGYGIACETTSMTAPDPTGAGVAAAARQALGAAGARAVGWVKTHGTGTKLNDVAECRGLAQVLGGAMPDVPLTALKAAIGHSMGASGGVEAAAAALAVERGAVPPSFGTEEVDPELPPCRIVRRAEPCDGRAALLLGESFGGRCAALVFERG